MTPIQRFAYFNDAEGIQHMQKLAVVDHLNFIVLIEHTYVFISNFLVLLMRYYYPALVELSRYYALAAVAALMYHLEKIRNVTFPAGSLRICYRGTDQTALIGNHFPI